jgi:hypothetical protein
MCPKSEKLLSVIWSKGVQVLRRAATSFIKVCYFEERRAGVVDST